MYDVSSKAGSDTNSLNECLNKCLNNDPVILVDLCGLIRSQMYPIIILADTEQAFLQVGIQEPVKDMTLFIA